MEQSRLSHCFNRVCVVGLGYIGLPTAAVLASRKVEVLGVDINAHAVETINQGHIHIVEPDLDIVVHSVVSEGYLKASLKPESSDAFLIAVPTPFKENHEPDLSYIQAAVQSVAPVLKEGDLIVLESTSPVGATEQLTEWLATARPDLVMPNYGCDDETDVFIAYCPERVLPGHVLRELIQNDRVIGGMTDACSQRAKALYEIFVEGECIVTHARTAEMCKLTENSFRDVNIAFANELSMICDKLDINVWELIALGNRHPRVNILNPGPGVGGHCIAVDPWFIVSKTPEEARLIKMARTVNDDKPVWVVNKVKDCIHDFLNTHPNKSARDVSIVCFGLTFKADIDDLRESPALDIVKGISEFHTGPLYAVEPNICELPRDISQIIQLVDDEKTVVQEADIILLLVNHRRFTPMFESSMFQRCKLIDAVGVVQHKGNDFNEQVGG